MAARPCGSPLLIVSSNASEKRSAKQPMRGVLTMWEGIGSNGRPARDLLHPRGKLAVFEMASHTSQKYPGYIPVPLERIATLPDASPLETRLVSLGVSALGKPKDPSPSVEWTLFRYRARGLSRLSIEATPRAALPHPREPATAFVTVDPTPDDPACPLAKATCYRRSRQSEWIARLPQGPSISTSESGVPIAELPYGTATPFLREASPLPTNGVTPARAVSCRGLSVSP